MALEKVRLCFCCLQAAGGNMEATGGKPNQGSCLCLQNRLKNKTCVACKQHLFVFVCCGSEQHLQKSKAKQTLKAFANITSTSYTNILQNIKHRISNLYHL